MDTYQLKEIFDQFDLSDLQQIVGALEQQREFLLRPTRFDKDFTQERLRITSDLYWVARAARDSKTEEHICQK